MLKETKVDKWFNTYFQDYTDLIVTHNKHNEIKQKRLLRKLISWLEVYENLENEGML